MRLKNIIIVSLFLLVILSSAVSAEDNETVLQDGDNAVDNIVPEISYRDNIYKHEDLNVNVTVPNNLNGTVSFKDKTTNITDGAGSIIVSDFEDNDFSLKITVENRTYDEKLNVMLCEVPHDYDLMFNRSKYVFDGSDWSISLYDPWGYNGTLTGDNFEFILDGKKINHTFYRDEDWEINRLIINSKTLSLGNHELKIIFSNDTYFNPYNKTYDIIVSPVISNAENKMDYTLHLYTRWMKGLTGTVTINVDGRKYKSADASKTTSIEIPLKDIGFGVHNITTSYSGDKKYSGFSHTDKVNVTYSIEAPQNAYRDESGLVYNDHETIIFTNNHTVFGEDADYYFTAPLDSEKDFNVEFNGVKSTVTKEKTHYSVKTSSLKLGDNEVIISYPGDSKFYAQSVKFNLHITSGISATGSPYMYGDDNYLLLDLPGDANGKLIVSVNNKSSETDFVNGIAYYSFKDLNPGKYHLEAYYSGDDYKVSKRSYDFEITHSVKLSNTYQNMNATLSIRLPENTNATAYITLNRDNFNVEIVNGSSNTALPVLPVGRHSISVRINQTTVTEYFNINPVFSVPDKMTVRGKDTVNVSDVDEGYLSYSLNGTVLSTVKVTDNRAELHLDKLPVGFNTVEIIYRGNTYYSEKFNITVFKLDKPQIVEDYDLTMYYYDGSSYKVCVVDENGNGLKSQKVTFKINGKKVKTVKTDSKGYASLKITKLPKKYTVSATWKKQTVKNKITVKKILTLEKVTVKKSDKKLVLTAKLKKALKNKKITFRFNGKKYTAKTDVEGIAKVTVKKSVLKNLKAGKKITYSAVYVKTTVKYTAKVKR